MQVSQVIDGVPQKGERCIFDVEDNPRAGIFHSIINAAYTPHIARRAVFASY
jgi:hypothetical protein